MLGVLFALFLTAGNYKAAFSLPDLTVIFGMATVGLTALLILHHGYVPRPTGLALAFWLLLCIISLLSTLCNPLHPGWAIKLSRLLLIDGWCFVGGTYVATRKQSLAAFMNVFLIVCLAVALSVFLSRRTHGNVSSTALLYQLPW